MSEKPPQFERPPVRVVGKSSEETKEKLREKIATRFKEGLDENFSDPIAEKFKTLEYDKRPYEVEFIVAANEIINKLRERYGLPPFQVSPDKIHIVPPELLREAGYGTGFTGLQDTNRQIIVANSEQLRQNITKTGRNMLHEITHLMGYVAFEAVDEDKKEVQEETDLNSNKDTTNKDQKLIWGNHRIGLMTFGGRRKSKEGRYYENFRGLNEAVVSEIENKYSNNIINNSNNPEVLAELEWLDSEEAQEIKREVAKKQNIPEDEITWVNKDQKATVIATEKTYRPQRKVLHYIVEQIAEEAHKDTEEIIDTFFKAHFTGNIVEIAKLINRVFDDELAFRALGMMGVEIGDGRQMLDYLKKKRVLVKKKMAKDVQSDEKN